MTRVRNGSRSSATRWFAMAVVVTSLATPSSSGVSLATCDTLSIPAIDIERCVVPGDQAEIDTGEIVRVERLSTPVVHWLAGHRSTHGAPFGALPELGIGDAVLYRGASYVVVEVVTVERYDDGHVLDWVGSTSPTVVLQTSNGTDHSMLWRADLEIGAADTAPIDWSRRAVGAAQGLFDRAQNPLSDGRVAA